MSEPSERYSTFDDIADKVSRANACWPDRISNLLISDLWNGEFDLQSLGWNEYKASSVLFDEPYDPDEPSPWVSKSVATEADRGRPGTFRPMSRDIAFNMLLAVNEPLASGLIDEAGEPKFQLLAEIELRRFGAKTQEILGDIAITNDARSQFCDRHGLKRSKTPETHPQVRPQSEAGSAPSGDLSAAPRASHGATEVPAASRTKSSKRQGRNVETHNRPVKGSPKLNLGRPKNSGSFSGVDQPLIEKMRLMIKDQSELSVWRAAGLVAEQAKGSGTVESKQTRLTRRYKNALSETDRN